MSILVVTERRSDPSFRLRWERFLPALEADVYELAGRGRIRLPAAAREADTVVLHRRLLNGLHFTRLRRASRRLVYDFDDALCYRTRRPHRSATRARRFFRTVAESDLVLAGNRVLAGLARLRARHVRVVPTTIDPDAYPDAPKRDGFVAVWIGQRATLPYLEAVRAAVDRAGARLRVIADAAPRGTEHVPWSLETQARALAECHVGLMPLPRDPWTRGKCGFKLLQYYATGLPAIVSPVGVNRSLAAGGALLAAGLDEWTAALERLRDDVALRAELGRRGRRFVARRYNAASLKERLTRMLRCGP